MAYVDLSDEAVAKIAEASHRACDIEGCEATGFRTCVICKRNICDRHFRGGYCIACVASVFNEACQE